MIYVYRRTLEVAPNVLERRTLEVALGAENVRAFIYSHVYNELLIRTLSLGRPNDSTPQFPRSGTRSSLSWIV